MSEFENKYFWEEGAKMDKLLVDISKVKDSVKRGIVIIEDGVIRKVDLFMTNGDSVKSESEKVIKLRSLTDDLVKSIENSREKGIGI
jgi:hypothetical protein